ncbi:Beta-galactosidase 7 [Dichanthelium oligosanthes]|uniref:Beta-galactosidase n=1 Tax=Dichanthelium oligosanthes TaxID=888268 RepID=A0A1E5UZ62_9POAL|nr:Beta-galactosidase 7 [Dichanthelium oligosanthes]
MSGGATTVAVVAVLAVLAAMAAAGRAWGTDEERGNRTAGRREVTYDGRALILDGARRMLFSGDMHYPRSTPEMWPDLIAKAKKGGLDVIQTYVFWNVHEPVQGQYNFEGRYDLVKFIREIHDQGLYVSLRIGPFVESEWKLGGLPFWLRGISNITLRCDNEPFKPISITNMSQNNCKQATNRYPVYHQSHMQKFVTKIVNLMKDERLFYPQGGPIIISQIENEYKLVEAAFHSKGPSYVQWAAAMAVNLHTGVPWMMWPNSPNKPALWTENWTSRYPVYGQDQRHRSAADLAFAVALFIARKKGSFVNYYMYHGGTNFGRFASSYVTTSYYDGAPLDEYDVFILNNLERNLATTEAFIGLPFRGFSAKPLHAHWQKPSICSIDDLYYLAFSPYTGHVFATESECVAFLINAQHGLRTAQVVQPLNHVDRWKIFKEPIPMAPRKIPHVGNQLCEHLSTTKDETDYLWYLAAYNYKRNGNDQLVLNIEAHAHILHAFINNDYLGNVHGSHDKPGDIVLKAPISLREGRNSISLLCVMVGSPVGLSGETNKIYKSEGSSRAEWAAIDKSMHLPLIWYKTRFDTPWGNDPVTLNLSSMGKGEVWINGESIGRYHIPRYFLKAGENLLVLMEEIGGDPLQITVNTMSVTRIYSSVSEFSTPSLLSREKHPAIHLRCQKGKHITDIEFASYGNPLEDCRKSGRNCLGSCHAEMSEFVVKNVNFSTSKATC